MKNSNKLGIGFDMVETSNFARLLKTRSTAWKQYFTEKELRYCFAKSHPFIHLAARFAAKEAVIKAFSVFKKSPVYSHIEILHQKETNPKVIFHDKSLVNYQTFLTISHTNSFGAAWVIVKKI